MFSVSWIALLGAWRRNSMDFKLSPPTKSSSS
jgi:hypothetical protein